MYAYREKTSLSNPKSSLKRVLKRTEVRLFIKKTENAHCIDRNEWQWVLFGHEPVFVEEHDALILCLDNIALFDLQNIFFIPARDFYPHFIISNVVPAFRKNQFNCRFPISIQFNNSFWQFCGIRRQRVVGKVIQTCDTGEREIHTFSA